MVGCNASSPFYVGDNGANTVSAWIYTTPVSKRYIRLDIAT